MCIAMSYLYYGCLKIYCSFVLSLTSFTCTGPWPLLRVTQRVQNVEQELLTQLNSHWNFDVVRVAYLYYYLGFFSSRCLFVIMKGKFKHWVSTIPPLSTKRPSNHTPPLKSLKKLSMCAHENSFNSCTFYWSAGTKLGKLEVMC